MNCVTYTHKGWFGICPIYIGNFQKVNDIPDIDYRHWIFQPLMLVSGFTIDSYHFIMSMIDDLHEPMYTMYITGKLNQPVTREYN